jgi:hypothetical protein
MMKATTSTSTCTSPNVDRSLRNVIAMNNLAIAMIEKKCYEQGSDTLYDAYKMIKRIATTATTAAETSPNYNDNCDYISYHHDALIRLSNPDQCRINSPVSFETITPLLSEPLFINLDSPVKVYFVRLEDTSFVDDERHTKSINVQCSIIANNLALSYMILSTVRTRQSDIVKFQKVACTFLRLSCVLYMHIVDTLTCVEENPEPYRLLGWILSNTEQVLQYCGTDQSEYNYIFGPKLLQLRNKIRKIDLFFLSCSQGINDHTAAMA